MRLNSGLSELGSSNCNGRDTASAGGFGGEFSPFLSPYPEPQVVLELPGLPILFCGKNLKILRYHIRQ